MIHCPFSKLVWTTLLTKLNLSPFICENPLEMMQSVSFRLDQGNNDIQTLGKLVVNAFVWHIWAERNGRIFQLKVNTTALVIQKILQDVCSRILYLGLQLLEALASHWNIPAKDQINIPFPLEV